MNDPRYIVPGAKNGIGAAIARELAARCKVKSWLGKWISVGRVAQPHEIAQIAAALMSALMTFLSGETICVDDGQGINH